MGRNSGGCHCVGGGFSNPVRADEQSEKALMEQMRIMQQRMDQLSKEVQELRKGNGGAGRSRRTNRRQRHQRPLRHPRSRRGCPFQLRRRPQKKPHASRNLKNS